MKPIGITIPTTTTIQLRPLRSKCLSGVFFSTDIPEQSVQAGVLKTLQTPTSFPKQWQRRFWFGRLLWESVMKILKRLIPEAITLSLILSKRITLCALKWWNITIVLQRVCRSIASCRAFAARQPEKLKLLSLNGMVRTILLLSLTVTEFWATTISRQISPVFLLRKTAISWQLQQKKHQVRKLQSLPKRLHSEKALLCGATVSISQAPVFKTLQPIHRQSTILSRDLSS